MNKFRTHNCSELTIKNSEENVILSGWINKKRDHGNLLFLDLAPFATAETFPKSLEKKTHSKLDSLNFVACNKKASD